MMKKSLFMDIFTLLIVSVMYSVPAYAYIEPGTGSMILALIMAAFVSIKVTMKLWWHKLKAVFKKNSNEQGNVGNSNIDKDSQG